MKVKFVYNGIKVDGVLYRAYYSATSLRNHPEGTITIYGKDYKDLPQIEGLTIENNSDLMTDYFENDRIRVTPDNPWYPQVAEAYNKQEMYRAKRTPGYTPKTIEINKQMETVSEEFPENVVLFNPDEPATKRQLWALHCITKMDTRDWVLTKKEASVLIGRAKKGENILLYVTQIKKAAR